MPGKGTTDAIFIMRQVQKKHQAKKKKLYYAFVDLEKAFDRVQREVVKFRELLPFLTSKAPSLEMKGRVYASCVRSSMTYGSETRPLMSG